MYISGFKLQEHSENHIGVQLHKNVGGAMFLLCNVL